jgi:hypothetical protein
MSGGASTGLERLLVFQDLADLGIPYHKDSIRRMVREGRFPPAIKLSRFRLAWREADVEAWVASRPVRGADWRAPWLRGGDGEMVAILRDNAGRRPPGPEPGEAKPARPAPVRRDPVRWAPPPRPPAPAAAEARARREAQMAEMVSRYNALVREAVAEGLAVEGMAEVGAFTGTGVALDAIARLRLRLRVARAEAVEREAAE